MNTENSDHIVMFPFMAKGHTIPLIHLAAALSARFGLRITFITTPANAPFIRASLPHAHLLLLPFPSFPPLPPACESTDTLPSFHPLFPAFLAATTLLRHPFDAALSRLFLSSPSRPFCLISDFFFGWTLPICRRLRLPRIVFHGMSAFSMALCKSLWVHLPEIDVGSGRPFHVPGTPPTLLLEKGDVPDSVLKSTDPTDPGTRFVSELGESDLNSWGVLVNSFAGIEGEYAGIFESFYRDGARAWLVGPTCLLYDGGSGSERDECIRWLDEQEARSVVYVSFGTQAEVAEEQLDEVARGLAESGCRFLWAVRSAALWAPPECASDSAGKIVGWAPQVEVLRHAAVGGILSHCGWNSVLEAVSAGVPILAWPMIAEQSLNAKRVVEGLGIGLRMGGTCGGLVRSEEVRERVKELMGGGEKTRRLRERAAELGKKAREAVEDGGSSCRMLEEMVEELRKCRREGEREGAESKLSSTAVAEFREGVQIA